MYRIIVMLSGAVLFGCSGDKSTGPPDDPAVGVYVLQTINGAGLPYSPANEAGIPSKGFTNAVGDSVLNDQYSIDADGTYSERTTVRDDRFGPRATREYLETGTWARTGSNVALTIHTSPNSSGTYSASVSGSTFIISFTSDIPFVYVYKKS